MSDQPVTSADGPGVADYITALESAPVHHFADWELVKVPGGPPGVYTIWRGEEFIYVGISYRDARDTKNPQARGLAGRLNSHASGRRSGDQFCIYICDRYLLPTLTPEQITQVGDGKLSLDALTRQYIRERLSYRYVLTATGDEAREVERRIQRNGLPLHGTPALNGVLRT
jgi:hypothetical protein